MKRPWDLMRSFGLSLFVHGVVASVLGGWLVPRESELEPIFREGASGLELTLVAPAAAPAPRKEEPAPTPVIPEPPPKPEDAPVLAPVAPAPEKELPDEEPDRKETEPSVEPEEEHPALPEADALAKGVSAPLASLTADLRPRYPLGSRLRGEEGRVTIKVGVNEQGVVEQAVVEKSSGFPALDRSALDAVSKAHFVSRDTGKPAKGEVALTFRFRLID